MFSSQVHFRGYEFRYTSAVSTYSKYATVILEQHNHRHIHPIYTPDVTLFSVCISLRYTQVIFTPTVVCSCKNHCPRWAFRSPIPRSFYPLPPVPSLHKIRASLGWRLAFCGFYPLIKASAFLHWFIDISCHGVRYELVVKIENEWHSLWQLCPAHKLASRCYLSSRNDMTSSNRPK